MSLTGSLHKLSFTGLENFKNTLSLDSTNPNDSIDISYFIIDLLQIIREHSEFNRKQVGSILEGTNIIEKEDGYLGFSTIEDVNNIKTTILDKIDIPKFKSFIENGIEKPNYFLSFYKNDTIYLENIVKYYSKIKEFYKQAVEESRAIVYVIG